MKTPAIGGCADFYRTRLEHPKGGVQIYIAIIELAINKGVNLLFPQLVGVAELISYRVSEHSPSFARDAYLARVNFLHVGANANFRFLFTLHAFLVSDALLTPLHTDGVR